MDFVNEIAVKMERKCWRSVAKKGATASRLVMKKDRSNQPSTSENDFSLPRAKILRGRKNFKRLFERDAHIIRSKDIKLRVKIIDNSSFGFLMGFIVKKSLGKANKRNTMKRLLKEAYRLHQHILSAPLREANVTLHGALMANSVDAAYHDIEQQVISLLEQVRDQLPATSSGHSWNICL